MVQNSPYLIRCETQSKTKKFADFDRKDALDFIKQHENNQEAKKDWVKELDLKPGDDILFIKNDILIWHFRINGDGNKITGYTWRHLLEDGSGTNPGISILSEKCKVYKQIFEDFKIDESKLLELMI